MVTSGDSGTDGNPPQAVALAELEAQASGMRILLADDGEANRILIVSSLKRAQSVIDLAENGAIAVGLFKAGHYDLVLMDVEMPVLNGYEATREIRRFESETGATPTPVLAMTAHTSAEITAQGSEAGFTDVLTKPILIIRLLQTLIRYRPAGMAPAPRAVAAPVDMEMRNMMLHYIQRRRDEIAVYRDAVDSGDFGAIKRMGHNMKGTGSGYGFPALTEFGAAIELAALGADSSALRAAVDRLAFYLQGIELEE